MPPYMRKSFELPFGWAHAALFYAGWTPRGLSKYFGCFIDVTPYPRMPYSSTEGTLLTFNT